MSKAIYAILNDLFFESKIRISTKKLNADLSILRNKENFDEAIAENTPNLIILDLASKDIMIEDIVTKLKNDERLKKIPLIGYLPHVETDLMVKYLDLGCNLVLPKSKFTREMDKLIKRSLL